MNIEVMAWSSLISGLMTFGAVKALSWMPFSIRLLIWFLGVALMGLAMIYLVACYDPNMIKQASVVAYWIMLASRIAVPILAVYVIWKWGSQSVRVVTMASLMTSACGGKDEHPTMSLLMMSGLLLASVWLIAEWVVMLIDKTRECRNEVKENSTTVHG